MNKLEIVKLKVFTIEHSPAGHGPTYDNVPDLLEDIKSHCVEEREGRLVILIHNMTRDKFEAMEEFMGY